MLPKLLVASMAIVVSVASPLQVHARSHHHAGSRHAARRHSSHLNDRKDARAWVKTRVFPFHRDRDRVRLLTSPDGINRPQEHRLNPDEFLFNGPYFDKLWGDPSDWKATDVVVKDWKVIAPAGDYAWNNPLMLIGKDGQLEDIVSDEKQLKKLRHSATQTSSHWKGETPNAMALIRHCVDPTEELARDFVVDCGSVVFFIEMMGTEKHCEDVAHAYANSKKVKAWFVDGGHTCLWKCRPTIPVALALVRNGLPKRKPPVQAAKAAKPFDLFASFALPMVKPAFAAPIADSLLGIPDPRP